ncbi:hypothetical protein [Sphingomonas sp. OTU376]|uniref:hypothetical protein n=1 Tax=Sphingomonas sp. OTU376 TaxID=3043863 RepID=UPI00313C2440
MAKDKKARRMGVMTISALGVALGAVIDAMKMADVPNDVAHHFLDQLEDGFEAMLSGEAQAIMLGLVKVLRGSVADND